MWFFKSCKGWKHFVKFYPETKNCKSWDDRSFHTKNQMIRLIAFPFVRADGVDHADHWEAKR